MIDFPVPSDKIIEVPSTIWTFVHDLAFAPWSYVSQAFWTVWTCPPFETFRNGLVVAWITWKNFASAHPIIAVVLALVVLAFIVVPWFRIFVLRCLGFMKNVPKGSMFALLQSLGARSGSPSVTATAIAVAIVVLGIVVIPRVLKGLWIFFLHCLGFLVWGVLRGPLVFAHPVIIAAVIVVLALVAIPRLLEALKIVFLHCLSFLGRGVLRPYAANYQSTEREERPDAYTVPVAASEERRAGGGGGYPAVGSTTGRR
ncbi:hypothetical protein HD554DRAFT_2328669 [Boletus coccyginus]|nr:hypothetical protein HD554DRAFT_2328669 [Boletus coccyginus]